MDLTFAQSNKRLALRGLFPGRVPMMPNPTDPSILTPMLDPRPHTHISPLSATASSVLEDTEEEEESGERERRRPVSRMMMLKKMTNRRSHSVPLPPDAYALSRPQPPPQSQQQYDETTRQQRQIGGGGGGGDSGKAGVVMVGSRASMRNAKTLFRPSVVCVRVCMCE